MFHVNCGSQKTSQVSERAVLSHRKTITLGSIHNLILQFKSFRQQSLSCHSTFLLIPASNLQAEDSIIKVDRCCKRSRLIIGSRHRAAGIYSYFSISTYCFPFNPSRLACESSLPAYFLIALHLSLILHRCLLCSRYVGCRIVSMPRSHRQT